MSYPEDTRLSLLPPEIQRLINKFVLAWEKATVILIQRVMRGTFSRVQLIPPAYLVDNEHPLRTYGAQGRKYWLRRRKAYQRAVAVGLIDLE